MQYFKRFYDQQYEKRTVLKRSVQYFSFDFNPFDNNDILDIHKYLMKGTQHKIVFEIIKRMLILLLSNIVNASNHTKCVSLSNQKREIWSTLINLHSNK